MPSFPLLSLRLGALSSLFPPFQALWLPTVGLQRSLDETSRKPPRLAGLARASRRPQGWKPRGFQRRPLVLLTGRPPARLQCRSGVEGFGLCETLERRTGCTQVGSTDPFWTNEPMIPHHGLCCPGLLYPDGKAPIQGKEKRPHFPQVCFLVDILQPLCS